MSSTPDNPVGRVLVLGAGGMLGRAWVELLRERRVPFDALDFPQFDLRDPEAPARAFDTAAYSHVFNAAAWTDVDGAQSAEQEAFELNAHAVARLATACAANDSHLVHISTDYVFAGDAADPYATEAPHAPVNAYGRSKADGETALFESGARSTLIRTSWLYAPWGRNFVRTMLRFFGERDVVRVVDDQRGCPTSARTLARAALDLASSEHTGVWHVTDRGETTWHGFASEIARLAGSSCRVVPCTSDEFPRPAARPGYSVLDIAKTERELPWLPTWQEALADTLDRIAHQKDERA